MADEQKTSQSSPTSSSTEDTTATPKKILNPTLNLDLQSVLQRHDTELEKKLLEDEKLNENNEPNEETRKNEEEKEEEEEERKRRSKTKMAKLQPGADAKGGVKKESGNKEQKRSEKENGDDDVKSHSHTEATATETMEKKILPEESRKDKEKKRKKKKKKYNEDEEKKDHKRKKKDRNEKSSSKERERNSKSKSPDREQRNNKGQQRDMEAKEGKSQEPSGEDIVKNVKRDKENEKELGSSPSYPLPTGRSSSSPKTEDKETEKERVEGTTNDEDTENAGGKGEQVTGNNDDQKDLKSVNQTAKSSAKQTNPEDGKKKEHLTGITEKERENAEEKRNNQPVKNSLKNIEEETEEREEGEKGGGEGGSPEEETGKKKTDVEEEERMEDSLRRGERTTGYLNMKKKGTFKFWKRYFFVMEDQILKYYKSHQDYQNLKNFRGTLDVFAMERVRERRQGFLKHNHYPFDIQRRFKSTVHLAAPTIEERDRWLALLQEALKKHKNPMRYSFTGLTEGIQRTASEQELRKYSTLPTTSSQARRDSKSSTSSSDTDGRNAQSEEGLDNRGSANRDSDIAVHPRVRFGVALNVKLDDIGAVKLKKARESLSAKNRQVDELPEEKKDEIEDENKIEEIQERFGVKLQPVKSDGPDKIRKISPTTQPRLSREPVLPIQKNSLAAKHGDTSPRKSPTPVHKEINNVPVIPLSKNMKQFVAKSQEDLKEQSSQEMEQSGEKPKEDSKKTEEETRKDEEQGKEEQKEEEERESKSVTDGVSSFEGIDDKIVSDKCITVDEKEGNAINGDEEEEKLQNLYHPPIAPKLSHASVKIIHFSETEDLLTDEIPQLDQVLIVEAPTPEKNERLQEEPSSDAEKTTISPKSDVTESEDNIDKGKEEEEPKQNVPGETTFVAQESVLSPSIVPTPPQPQDPPDLSLSSRKKETNDPCASPRPSERRRTNTGSSIKSNRSDSDNESSIFRFLKGGRSESKGEIYSKNKEDHSQARERMCSDSSLAQKTRSSFLKIFKKEKSKPDRLSGASIAEGDSGKEQEQSSMKNEEPSDKTDLTIAEENESKNPNSTKQGGEDAILSEPGVKLRIRLENENLQVRSSYCSINSYSSVEEDPKPRIPEKSRKREQSPYYDVPQNNRPVPGAAFQMVYTEGDPEEKAPVDGCITQEQIESILDSKEKRKKSVSQYPGPFLSLPLPEGNNRGSNTSSVSANSTSSDTDRPPYLSSISTDSDDPLPTTNFLGSNRSSVDSVTLRESVTLLDKETESDLPMNETGTAVNASASLRQASEATLGVNLGKRKSNTANRSSFTTSELVAVNEEEETDNDDSMMKEGARKATENKERGVEEKEVELMEEKGEEKDEKQDRKEKEEKGKENEEKEEKEGKEEEKEEMVKEENDEEADESDYFPTLSLDVEHRPIPGSLQAPLPGNTPGLRTSGIMALSQYLEQLKDNGEEEPVTGRGISRLGHSAAVEKLKETLEEE